LLDAFRQTLTVLPTVVDSKLTSALQQFSTTNPVEHQAIQTADLITVRCPYVTIAIVVTLLFLLFLFSKLPSTMAHDNPLTKRELKETFRRLFQSKQCFEMCCSTRFLCWYTNCVLDLYYTL
jgi:FHS family L-fucose permease-like MFS transporter